MNNTDEMTAADLIKRYGDQAYHKAVQIAYKAARAHDKQRTQDYEFAAFVLMGMGYHKKKRDPRDVFDLNAVSRLNHNCRFKV